MRGRAISGGKALAGYDERGRIGPEVVKELHRGEQGQEEPRDGLALLVEEAERGEECREEHEAHQLYAAAPDAFDEEDGEAEARHGAHARDYQIAARVLEKHVVLELSAVARHRQVAVVADGVEYVRLVEIDAVEAHVQSEPGERRAQQHAHVRPLGEVSEELGKRGPLHAFHATYRVFFERKTTTTTKQFDKNIC